MQLARDTIKLRQIMQQKRIEQKAIEFPKDPDSKQMILSRVIGFKEQMPGSGQWRMLDDPVDQCWHCDQWIYSLIFWDAETIGKQAQKTTHHKVHNQMVKLVESLNPEILDLESFMSLSVYDEDASEFSNQEEFSADEIMNKNQQQSPQKKDINNKNKMNEKSPSPEAKAISDHSVEKDKPVLFGSFNEWKGQEMMSLEDFVGILAK